MINARTAVRFGVEDARRGRNCGRRYRLADEGNSRLILVLAVQRGEGSVRSTGASPYAETRDYVPKLSAFQVARLARRRRVDLGRRIQR